MKRKYSNKHEREKKKKVSTLPDIVEDDIVFNDIITSNDELDVSDPLLNHQSLNHNVETSDEDLPEGILNSQTNQEKLQPGDLVWIKHTRNGYYWPSYIKSISNNKASIYFLSYSKFTKGEKCFRYPINSRKMRRLHNPDYHKIIEEGKKFYQNQNTKNAGKKTFEDNIDDFNNAVELAELYTLHCNNKGFANEQEIFEFFRTNGLSLCYKDNLSLACERCSQSEECTSASSLNVAPLTASRSVIPAEESSLNNGTCQNVDTSTLLATRNSKVSVSDQVQENVNVDLSPENTLFMPLTERQQMKTLRDMKIFNEKNVDIVEYILNGLCDDHLRNILKLKAPSNRMDAFFMKWDEDSLVPKSKNTVFDVSYFEDDEQLKLVCEYLRNFIEDNANYMVGLIKKNDLLFNVFLPEATIYSIHKVTRKRLKTAEKIFNHGCYQMKRTLDASFYVPLTPEERCCMKWKLDELAKKLNCSLLPGN